MVVSPSASTDVLKVEFRRAIFDRRETTFQLSTINGTLPAIRAIVPVITRRPATLVHAEQVASSSALVGVAVTACLTRLVRIEFIHQHGWTRFLNTTLGTNDVEQVGASELNIFVFAKLIETTQVNELLSNPCAPGVWLWGAGEVGREQTG
jgi:hypothetical protein